jgi:hypothetical protein
LVFLRSAAAGLLLGVTSAVRAEDKPLPSAVWPSNPDLLVFYVVVLVVFLCLLHLVDALSAYKFSELARDRFLEKLRGGLSPEQVSKLATDLGPSGIQGTTRSILAYALILILGIAVFHLATVSKFSEAPAYVDKILTVLAGSLASIIGFYFGSKASKDAADSARQQPEPRSAPGGRITTVVPSSARPGERIRIEGEGFGDHGGTVKVGAVSVAHPDSWKAQVIEVVVPSGAPLGATAISVNPSLDTEIVGSPTLFTVLAPTAPGPAGQTPPPTATAAPASITPAPTDLIVDKGSFDLGDAT